MTQDPLSVSFVSAAYLRAKAIWKGQRPRRLRVKGGKSHGEQSVPFGTGREPRLLGELFATSMREMGWSTELSQAQLIESWPRFMGERTAAHTRIVDMRDGVLIVQCDSTAWATELRRLRAEVLSRILEEFPEAEISEIRFVAPGAPTWRHGRRTVRGGRGPRDTYG